MEPPAPLGLLAHIPLLGDVWLSILTGGAVRLLPKSPPPPPTAAAGCDGGATSGCGSAMTVVLNRSSSSFSAEYLSPAGADWGAGPRLTFLLVGGRVLEGGAVRGSETLLVLTQGLLTTTRGGLVLLALLVVSAPELNNNELNRLTPSCWLESSGSLGGREDSGARKGLDTALTGGQDEETGEVKKGLNGDFFTGEGGAGGDMLACNN